MTTEKTKSLKSQIMLPATDAAEFISFLQEKKGNQKVACKKLGVTRQTVSNWIEKGKVPQYCLPYLEQLRTLKQWSSK